MRLVYLTTDLNNKNGQQAESKVSHSVIIRRNHMIFLLYQFGIRVYELLLIALAPFQSKIKKMVLGRRKTLSRVQAFRSDYPIAETVWFHAASVGEFEQALPIIRLLKSQHSDLKIAVSFYSPSGFELLHQHPLADVTFYLPPDRPSDIRRLIRNLKPSHLLIVKYEFWYNLIYTAHRLQIPVYAISCILTAKKINQFFYGRLLQKTFSHIDHFFVQNIETSKILQDLGFNNISLNGDTRIDRVLEIKELELQLPWLEVWKQGHKLLIVGSAWLEDILYLKDFIKHAVVEAHGLWRVLIVPHELQEDHLVRMEEAMGLPFERFSRWEKEQTDTDILIFDQMGLLSRLYRFADAAWIGGAFKTGLHNILEAAVYGIPVAFGPQYQKFQEAVDLIELKIAKSFPNQDTVWAYYQSATEIEEEKKRISETAERYFERHKGASLAVIEKIWPATSVN